MKHDLRALKTAVDDAFDADRLDGIGRRVRATRRLPRRSSKLRIAGAIGILASVVAIFAWRMGSHDERPPGPLALASGASFEHTSAGPIDLALADGSTLALGPGAHLETVENTATRVVLVQGQGRVVYDIRPGGPRRWSIDAGLATVDVIGTRFTVDRGPERVRVEVARGRVRVRAPSVLRLLDAGESIAVPPELSAVEPAVEVREPIVADAPEPARERIVRTHAEPPPLAAPPEEPAAEPAPWRELAARGSYDEAFASLGPDGVRAATASASARDLFLLADIARLSGHPELAVAPLERIVATRDPQAGVAAVTLGRIQLDALDAPEQAVGSLERALEAGVPAHLRETVLARLIDAQRRAGRPERARDAAARYLREYPSGLHAAEARALTTGSP